MSNPSETGQPAVGGDLTSRRAFFATRAAGWEERFPDDDPAYEVAVAQLHPPERGTVLDAACGTGRALPFLRQAVGPAGLVIGLDVTPEMLREANRRGRQSVAEFILGDVERLPLPRGSIDAILGAGLLPHLADPAEGLAELARVTRPGGRLALFHPIGRAALAARHGRPVDPADIRSQPAIGELLVLSGWDIETVDDGPDRYLVTASRHRVPS